jgi:hypothetical protein
LATVGRAFDSHDDGVVGGWALERPGKLLNSLAGAGMVLLLWCQLFRASSFFFRGAQHSALLPRSDVLATPVASDPLPGVASAATAVDRPCALLLNLGCLSAWLNHFRLSPITSISSPWSVAGEHGVVPLSSAVLTCNLEACSVLHGCPRWRLFNHAGWLDAGDGVGQ